MYIILYRLNTNNKIFNRNQNNKIYNKMLYIHFKDTNNKNMF